AEALDADLNRVTTGPGASAPIRFVAYADSLGPGLADPDLVDDSERSRSDTGTGRGLRAGPGFSSSPRATRFRESNPLRGGACSSRRRRPIMRSSLPTRSI